MIFETITLKLYRVGQNFFPNVLFQNEQKVAFFGLRDATVDLLQDGSVSGAEKKYLASIQGGTFLQNFEI